MAKVKEPTVTKKAARSHKGQRVGYIRVSTLDQREDRQLDGVELDKRFVDRTSGKDIKRPQLTALLGFIRDGDTGVPSELGYQSTLVRIRVFRIRHLQDDSSCLSDAVGSAS